jgi:hypothetical protein
MTTRIEHYSTFRRRRDYNQEEFYNESSESSESTDGYTVENLDKNNNFINYLIKRRLASNSSGFSSHIAAFVSKIGSKQQCLLRRKGKHRYRRKF